MASMTDITSSTESDVVEPATMIGSPEHVYLAVVINPDAGNQIITAHRTRDGADSQIDDLATTWSVSRDLLQADVLELPLLP